MQSFNRLFCRYFIIVSVLSLMALSYGCDKNRKNVNVSGIDVKLDIKRLDQDLAALPPAEIETRLPDLLQKYPQFLPFYMGRMMGFGDFEKDTAQTIDQFRQFLSDSNAHLLIDTTAKAFKDFEEIEEELTEAFQHFKYYYPNRHIPEVVTYVSYFGWSTITYDSTVLGIGLDMYMGEDFVYPPDIPDYITRTFKREYIVPNSMKVMSTLLYQFDSGEDSRLIGSMVQNGKQLYFLDMMVPDADDYLKMDYRKEDIEWCKDNEPEIWKFFLDKELIYSSNVSSNAKYVTPGPNTPGMPPDAPGNIGSWVGWQIVRKYMEQYPETTFDQLMKLDAQQILVQSRYKPRHGMFQ